MELNEQNFEFIAIKAYTNINCIDAQEIYNDLDKITLIKKSFCKFKRTKEINIRLVLNHLILLYNVFEQKSLTKILIFRFDQDLELIKPLLIYLNRWPDENLIGLDKDMIKLLREIT